MTPPNYIILNHLYNILKKETNWKIEYFRFGPLYGIDIYRAPDTGSYYVMSIYITESNEIHWHKNDWVANTLNPDEAYIPDSVYFNLTSPTCFDDFKSHIKNVRL